MNSLSLLLLACTPKDETVDSGSSILPTGEVNDADILATGRYDYSNMHDVEFVGDVNGDGY